MAAVLALLAWGGSSFLFSGDPGPALGRILSAAGFGQAVLPEPEKKRGVLIYSDISLDPDGFSSIRRLEIEGGRNGKIKALRIEGLTLTGELGKGLEIAMAGWSRPSPADLRRLPILPDAPVVFEDVQVELLSESVGGIELRFDLEIRPGAEGREILARLKGAQQQLSYDAGLTGLVTPEGIWQINAEVEQAKFDLGPLKSTRISGQIGVTGEKFRSPEIVGSFQAGGLTLLGLPWQNVAITLEGDLENTRMIVGAKSAGIEGVELGLTLGNVQNPGVYAGSLHSESIGDLLEYLQGNGALPFPGLPSGEPAEAQSLETEFRGNGGAIVFDLPATPERPALTVLIKPAYGRPDLGAITEGQEFTVERRESGGAAPETATFSYFPAENRIISVPDGTPAKLDLRTLKIVR